MAHSDDALAQKVDELLLEALERLSAGDSNAVESLCSRHPECADRLRERIDSLRRLNLLPVDPAAMAFPERLGEFRLLRRLGGGGMGVVYEALQESLGRVVALKLIRPEQLYFERSKDRFRREVEAVSRLDHEGIVKIFTVGEVGSVPYFAMEMVHGASLSQVLEQLDGAAPERLLAADLRAALLAMGQGEEPIRDELVDPLFEGTWTDACLDIALRMTEALAHAHARGVRHRDIKPSNINVTTEGRVVLLDFGLASLSNESPLTTSGSTIGSVPYMAPEQLEGRGSDVDERTDVYAMGVTLYELLTLRQPFANPDAASTRAAILDGNVRSLRLLNRAIPQDLEIVCLHAMQRERSRRYRSMAEFAADLRRLRDGFPIAARAPSSVYRLRRWAARRPALASSVVLVSALVTVLPTSLYLQQRTYATRLEDLLDAATRAQDAAVLAGGKAELEADEAQEVANFLVTLFGASDPYSVSERDISARQLLEHAVGRIQNDLSDQPALQVRLYERIGESYTNLDRYTEALVPLERALDLSLRIYGEADPCTADARFLLGSAARLAHRQGGEALVRSALQVYETHPDANFTRHMNAHAVLALYRLDANDATEARSLIRTGLEESEARAHPHTEARRMLLALLARIENASARPVEAEAAARAALALPDPHEANRSAWSVAANECLTVSLAHQDCLEEATQACDAALPLIHAVHGTGSASAIRAELRLLAALQDNGKTRGLSLRLPALADGLASQLGDDHEATRDAGLRAAVALSVDGEHEAAIERLQRMLQILVRSGQQSSQAFVVVLFRLGSVLVASGDVQGAISALRSVREREIASTLARNPVVELMLAFALLGDEDGHDEAGALARDWIEFGDRELASIARYVLARVALRQGRPDEATAQLRWVAALPHERRPGDWIGPACRVVAAELAVGRGEHTLGCPALAAALGELDAAIGPTHAEVRRLRSELETAGISDACAQLRR